MELAIKQVSSRVKEEDNRFYFDFEVMNDDLLAEVELSMAHMFVNTQKRMKRSIQLMQMQEVTTFM